jgi:hypothetical protein
MVVGEHAHRHGPETGQREGPQFALVHVRDRHVGHGRLLGDFAEVGRANLAGVDAEFGDGREKRFLLDRHPRGFRKERIVEVVAENQVDGIIADCRRSEEDLVLVGGSSFGAFSAQVQLQVITERDSRTLLRIRLFMRCPSPLKSSIVLKIIQI